MKINNKKIIKILNKVTTMIKTTKSANNETVKRDWFIVDATDKVLGRLATQLAHHLRGKHKAEYTPHVDTGDYIVLTNAGKVKVTGGKPSKKKYFSHSGFQSGLKETTFEKLIVRDPANVIERAVKGMLPKGPLGYKMLAKLKIYAGDEHPHEAQQPKVLEI